MSLSDNVSRAEKERKVDSIIKKLRLEKCANTYVGGAGVVRGISGGERKRCAIGVELVTDPMVSETSRCCLCLYLFLFLSYIRIRAKGKKKLSC